MDYIIKYWEENTDFEELNRQIGNRKIAVWGAYINGKHVRRILKEKGLEVSFYIDGHKNACEYDNLPIRRPNKEIGRDVYVFIAVIGVREEIIHYLNLWDMKEGKEYTYISKMLRHVVITECVGGYADCNGNRLECADDRFQCRIEFKGFNSKIKIGKGFVAGRGVKIVVENGCEVIIGDYVTLHENVVVEALTSGRIKIGDNCLCYKDSQITVSEKGAIIELGNYVTMGERFFCVNTSKNEISIGNDCMFSHDVSIILGGHSIFDLGTKENILLREKHIKIGDHVWLGKNVVILDNAEIGRGDIVGASSVVKLKADENCVIAGNPARIIKVNHTWDRRHNIEFDDV